MKLRYNFAVLPSLRIIYSSTTGNTEFAVDTLIAFLAEKQPQMVIHKQRAEQANADDLRKDDALILACGTWNTGNVEGQLSPHMHALLQDRAKDVDFREHPCAVIGLGDERYYFTARAMDRLSAFVTERGGSTLVPPLKIVNDPYGQEEKIRHWAEELLTKLKTLPPTDIE